MGLNVAQLSAKTEKSAFTKGFEQDPATHRIILKMTSQPLTSAKKATSQMTQMLESLDKDFNTASVTVLHKIKVNSLEMNRTIDILNRK